jgi:uncharacterized protein YkwD
VKPWHAVVLVAGLVVFLSGSVRGQDAALAPAEPENVRDAAGCPRSGDFPEPPAIEVTRAAILCLHNAQRAKYGLPALVRNPLLELAAQRHSDDMAARDFFSHTTPEGADPQARIATAGYRREWTGENLYFGTGFEATPVRAMRGWMRSPGHRENVLRPQFLEVGIGISYDSPKPGGNDRAAVYTANFGA